MSPKKLNRILAAVVFIISFIVYFDTMAPTVSFWDCGEFIATSYTLGVPHPPGSPLYLIIGRIFSMIPFGDDIAFRVNLISTIVTSFTVMFLYLIIVQFFVHVRGAISTTRDKLTVFGSALVGSLTFAFSDSLWFNAVEAEVYSMSTFFTAIVVWLILLWAERSEKPGNERYVLLISYMLGLAAGIHLLNLLAIPFMALIVYFKKREFSWPSFFAVAGISFVIFLVIYKGVIKGLPKLALKVGFSGIAVLLLVLLIGTAIVIVKKHHLWSLIFASLVLIIVGYSTYTMIYIRSNQNPSIDENNPETVKAFINYTERVQYGSITLLPRKFNKLPPMHEVVGPPKRGRNYSGTQKNTYRFYEFDKQLKFLWNYQIVKMYLRYFLWQFVGKGPADEKFVSSFGAKPKRNEDGVYWFQFGLPLAFFLGIFGMVHHFKKDWAHAFSVLSLILLTGVAIVLYLNQDNPQPRERDYVFTGSFLAFAIWIAFGAGAILDRVVKYCKEKDFVNHALYATIVVQMILVPGVMAFSNHHSHNRSGNYVAWDYSYNILQTCEPNSIIFTNGDNDTFPLWYLQEVEGVRKDVTVANLSLLNTDWYIRQLRDSRPKGERFINLTDSQISGVQPIGKNPATGKPLFLQVSQWKTTPVTIPVKDDPLNNEGKISWELKPTFGKNGIRVQDLMIFHIIKESKWRYPIYFAVTVSHSNKIRLDKYLDMEGLAFRLKSHKTGKLIDYDNLKTNLLEKYQYRNLNNPEVYYNPNIIKLLQNYRSAFLQLADDDLRRIQKKRKKEPLLSDDELERLQQEALATLDSLSIRIPEEVIPKTSYDMDFHLGRIYLGLGDFEKSLSIYENLYYKNPGRPEIVGMLLKVYEELEDWDKAISVVNNWLEKNSDDPIAKDLLKEYQSKKADTTGL